MFYVATALSITACCTLLPFGQSLSFHPAGQACEFAGDASCGNIYASVFGGSSVVTSSTLQGSGFRVFLPALFADCFYRMFKSGLYVFHDWNFMAFVGLATFV